MSDSREAFKQIYSIPTGAEWCEKRHIYIHKNYSGLVLHPINESWEAFCEGALWQASRQEGEPIGFLQSSGVSQLSGGHPAKLYPIGATPSPFESSTLVYTHPASSDEWIKCSERLPPEADHYLVALSDPEDVGWVTDKAWTAFYNKCGEWDCCEAVEDGQPVTHWMPLPAPPQEQGQ